jgi:hypothetical protein
MEHTGDDEQARDQRKRQWSADHLLDSRARVTSQEEPNLADADDDESGKEQRRAVEVLKDAGDAVDGARPGRAKASVCK